jgi:hypothetical protein
MSSPSKNDLAVEPKLLAKKEPPAAGHSLQGTGTDAHGGPRRLGSGTQRTGTQVAVSPFPAVGVAHTRPRRAISSSAFAKRVSSWFLKYRSARCGLAPASVGAVPKLAVRFSDGLGLADAFLGDALRLATSATARRFDALAPLDADTHSRNGHLNAHPRALLDLLFNLYVLSRNQRCSGNEYGYADQHAFHDILQKFRNFMPNAEDPHRFNRAIRKNGSGTE